MFISAYVPCVLKISFTISSIVDIDHIIEERNVASHWTMYFRIQIRKFNTITDHNIEIQMNLINTIILVVYWKLNFMLFARKRNDDLFFSSLEFIIRKYFMIEIIECFMRTLCFK